MTTKHDHCPCVAALADRIGHNLKAQMDREELLVALLDQGKYDELRRMLGAQNDE